MGTQVTKETQDATATYLAAFDKAPFYNYYTGGALLNISATDPGFQDFSYFFNALFPMPNMAEQELPETEGQYKDFKKKYGLTVNPYEDWVRQCYAHIQQGYRVGIPYLENKPNIINGKNTLIPNLPPCRYHHLKNYMVNGIPVYSGTAILVRMLQKKYGFHLGPDACNYLFDKLFYQLKADKTFIEEFTQLLHDASAELREIQPHDSPLGFDPKVNADQSPTSNDVISNVTIQKGWGKRGHMKQIFPTMWYRWKDNLYGDGSKVDPDFAPIGFPRFHEDFVNKTIQGIPGTTQKYNAPSKELFQVTSGFITLYGYKIVPNVMSPKSKIITDAHAWIVANGRWNLMNKWLIDNYPEILFYYYIDFGQFEASYHPDYLRMMGLLIFEYVAIWMHTPTGGSKIVKWKNDDELVLKEKELGPASIHHDDEITGRPPPGTKFIEVTDLQGRAIEYTIYGKTQYEDVGYKVDPETGRILLKVWRLPDGTMMREDFDANGNPTLNQLDKDGQLITKIDARWSPPKGDIQFENPNVFEAESFRTLRQHWEDSHLSILGFDGTDWKAKLDQVIQSNSNDYLKKVFVFMKQYPLPKPVTPGVFEDPKYRDAFGNLFGVELRDSAWKKACDVQWYYYLIWVETNVNAYGTQNYVKPGDVFPQKTPNGDTVINAYPNTGILAPYEGNEGIGKVLHIATLGLTFLFGDRWWSDIYYWLKQTLVFVLKWLREHAPEIGLSLALLAVGALAVFAGFQYVGEKSRKLA